jgi:stage V sporulation protein G
MKITAKIHRIIPGGGRLKAIAEVMLDGEFVIHNVRVVEGKHGLFASMPSYTDRVGSYRDHCFPITQNCTAKVNNAVTEAYREACESLIY